MTSAKSFKRYRRSRHFVFDACVQTSRIAVTALFKSGTKVILWLKIADNVDVIDLCSTISSEFCLIRKNNNNKCDIIFHMVNFPELEFRCFNGQFFRPWKNTNAIKFLLFGDNELVYTTTFKYLFVEMCSSFLTFPSKTFIT